MYCVSPGSSAYPGCSLVDSVFIWNPVRPLLLHDVGIVYIGRESFKSHVGAYCTQCFSFCSHSFFVIFILLLTILSSCKSEYEEYSGTDAIYLNEISDTVRFSFTYVDSEYETQAQDIHLKVIGKVADYDRPVNIKFTPVNAVEGVDFEPLEKEYVVKKGEVSLVIPVFPPFPSV